MNKEIEDALEYYDRKDTLVLSIKEYEYLLGCELALKKIQDTIQKLNMRIIE